MAKPNQAKFAVTAWLVAIADRLAKLLDLRLASKMENSSEEEQWPLRQTLLFVVGISLIVWGGCYAVFRFLLRL